MPVLITVPNAPCGVERSYSLISLLTNSCVPNAPCGVERREEDIEGLVLLLGS